MQNQRKSFSGKRNGDSSRRSNSKERPPKSALYAENQDILQKNCPKREKAAKLLKQAQIHAEDTPFFDVESFYSLDDKYSPQALVVMGYSITKENSDSELVALDPEIQAIYTSQPT